MPLPKEKYYTLEDIYNLPDGQRAELIDGQIYMLATPSSMHQDIVGTIHVDVVNYIRANDGKCKVYESPFAVYLKQDDDDIYLQPDLSVICDRDKIDDRGCHGAPDWVVEVVSPSSKKMDYLTKAVIYQNAGVRDYWIVDPVKKVVVVYNFENDVSPIIYRFTDKVKSNIFPELEIDFSEMEL